MSFRADSLGLAGSITVILRDLVHEHLGIYYQDTDFSQLADRLAQLVIARGLGSFMDYYYLLKYEHDPDEWLRVMDALSVQETYFCREIDQLRAVVDTIVPSLVEMNPSAPLRFWSAPCATGEEPLTLAMLLDQAGWFSKASVEIVGSDASGAAIAKARQGRYGARSFRNMPPALRDRYFTSVGENMWAIDPDLHRRVVFDVVNLMDAEAVRSHASVPVVLCRNVFIYFSDRSILRTVSELANAMTRPGYLCLGTSESLLRLNTPFELREMGGAFVYVLGEGRQRQTDAAPVRMGLQVRR